MVSGFQGAGRCLCAIALVLLSLCVTSCTQLSTISQQASATGNSAVLEFVSRQALLTTLIDLTDESMWQRSFVNQGLSQAVDSLVHTLEIDFSKDIRPWLGHKVVFAITDQDFDRNSLNGHQTGYLLAVDISDSEQLRERLGLFWQRQSVAGAPLQFTQTKGVSIITGTPTHASLQLSTAIVGEHTLLIANDLQVLRRSLQVAQAPQLQMPVPNQLTPLWVTLQIPAVVNWLGLAIPAQQRYLKPQLWRQLTATAMVNPLGIVVDTQLQSWQKPGTENPAQELDRVESTAKVQQYLPNTMAWAAMGHNLSPLWANIQVGLQPYQNLPAFLQQFQQWGTTDMANELVQPISQLLSNDYGLGQLGDGSWVMAVSPVDPRILEQLDELAAAAGLTVSQFTLNGHTVTAWSQLKTRIRQDARNRETTVETDVLVLRTNVNDCDVFSTSLSSLTAALEAPGQSLPSSQRFRRTVQVMDTPNQGYLYGTWNELERLLASNRWFSLVQPIVQPWGQSIDAIAITSYGHTMDQSTGTVSVLLKK